MLEFLHSIPRTLELVWKQLSLFLEDKFVVFFFENMAYDHVQEHFDETNSSWNLNHCFNFRIGLSHCIAYSDRLIYFVVLEIKFVDIYLLCLFCLGAGTTLWRDCAGRRTKWRIPWDMRRRKPGQDSTTSTLCSTSVACGTTLVAPEGVGQRRVRPPCIKIDDHWWDYSSITCDAPHSDGLAS